MRVNRITWRSSVIDLLKNGLLSNILMPRRQTWQSRLARLENIIHNTTSTFIHALC